ncbi:MAG: DUF2344 domain-containing protein [Anaerolineae bacterium]|jgi:radical SAM-linked protein|nr:DUF2344 domain-containing protein [Anaerolineae bacterium]MBT3714385.1 DUF2344 domain-containing protein [Anaerolineae bacterium]MBT4309294.1 DUF2344 domain-containing protein [Anaerolineae bacterium]MBT4457227.1 DUF2344 domain-containing protein [Anaerolineae bacterium]MBT4841938.1 DUF2344 domain-containing protein [Anaerolineae bacterium]
MSEAIPATRLRIKFAKQGALRYIGHLDLHHIWQRSIRRAGLPLVYSQGFHPQPKIQIASALPLGFSSKAEIVDIWIEKDAEWAIDDLQAAAPEGITILDMQEVELRGPALQTLGDYAEYEVTILDEIPANKLDLKLASLMDAESLLREKKKKKRGKVRTYDLRKLILDLHRLPSTKGENERIYMRFTAQEGATGRPDMILKEMDIPIEAARVERTALVFKS